MVGKQKARARSNQRKKKKGSKPSSRKSSRGSDQTPRNSSSSTQRSVSRSKSGIPNGELLRKRKSMKEAVSGEQHLKKCASAPSVSLQKELLKPKPTPPDKEEDNVGTEAAPATEKSEDLEEYEVENKSTATKEIEEEEQSELTIHNREDVASDENKDQDVGRSSQAFHIFSQESNPNSSSQEIEDSEQIVFQDPDPNSLLDGPSQSNSSVTLEDSEPEVIGKYNVEDSHAKEPMSSVCGTSEGSPLTESQQLEVEKNEEFNEENEPKSEGKGKEEINSDEPDEENESSSIVPGEGQIEISDQENPDKQSNRTYDYKDSPHGEQEPLPQEIEGERRDEKEDFQKIVNEPNQQYGVLIRKDPSFSLPSKQLVDSEEHKEVLESNNPEDSEKFNYENTSQIVEDDLGANEDKEQTEESLEEGTVKKEFTQPAPKTPENHTLKEVPRSLKKMEYIRNKFEEVSKQAAEYDKHTRKKLDIDDSDLKLTGETLEDSGRSKEPEKDTSKKRRKKKRRHSSDKRPLYVVMEENYKKNVVLPEIERRENFLNNLKQRYREGDFAMPDESQLREFEKAHQKRLDEFRERRKKDLASFSEYDSSKYYSGKARQLIKQEEEQARLEEIKREEGLKQRLRKKKEYAEQVRHQKAPKIDEKKRQEIELIKQRDKKKNVRSTNSPNRSPQKPRSESSIRSPVKRRRRKVKKESEKEPEPTPFDQHKKIMELGNKYMQEGRSQARHVPERRHSIDGTEKIEKLKKLRNQARAFENKLFLNKEYSTNEDIEEQTKVNQMYLGAIRAKIELLKQME